MDPLGRFTAASPLEQPIDTPATSSTSTSTASTAPNWLKETQSHPAWHDTISVADAYIKLQNQHKGTYIITGSKNVDTFFMLHWVHLDNCIVHHVIFQYDKHRDEWYCKNLQDHYRKTLPEMILKIIHCQDDGSLTPLKA